MSPTGLQNADMWKIVDAFPLPPSCPGHLGPTFPYRLSASTLSTEATSPTTPQRVTWHHGATSQISLARALYHIHCNMGHGDCIPDSRSSDNLDSTSDNAFANCIPLLSTYYARMQEITSNISREERRDIASGAASTLLSQVNLSQGLPTGR